MHPDWNRWLHWEAGIISFVKNTNIVKMFKIILKVIEKKENFSDNMGKWNNLCGMFIIVATLDNDWRGIILEIGKFKYWWQMSTEC